MAFSFKKLNLRSKLFFIFIMISVLPILLLGIISYFLSSSAINNKVKENLTSQVQYYKSLILDDYSKIAEDSAKLKNTAKQIVEQQAKIVYKMIDYAKNENEEILKNNIASLTVGETGYIFVLSYDGKYIVSKNRQSDGEDIINSQDANGRYFIQDILRKGKALSGSSVDFDIYPWKNVGETVASEKIAAIIHYPSKRWIIGVSAYYKDLLDIEVEKKVITRFKEKLKKEKVGKTGYMYVMNSKGDLIMHPDKEGENIYEFDYIKEICKTHEGYIAYNWEGKKKIVGFTYFDQKDWIIASGSYYSDFTNEIKIILFSLITIIVVTILLTIIFVLFFTKSTINPLLKIADNLGNSSAQISLASTQLSSSSQEIANGATEQASSIEETTTSMEELASIVKQNADNAREASSLSQKTSEASEIGYTQMEDMLDSMTEINKSSGEINKIIKVIDDIAFQTNILALNAAVEAARAGEAGMGFAVVADEVKNLANKAADAAKETAEMIENSIKRTEGGLEIAKKLAEIFKEILTNVQKVTEVSKEVETASVQQDEGINQVNKAIVQFDEVVQGNASSAEETASSAEELLTQVETLNDVVKQLVLIVTGKEETIETKQHHLIQQQEKKVDIKNKQITFKQKNKPDTVLKQEKEKQKKKEINPEKIIPFEEDEEFKEF